LEIINNEMKEFAETLAISGFGLGFPRADSVGFA